MYLFVSIIALLINISALCIGYAYSGITGNQSSIGTQALGYSETEVRNQSENLSFLGIVNVGSSLVGSFIPFISMASIIWMPIADAGIFIAIYILITVLIGFIQTVLIILMIVGAIPFFNT